MRSSSHVVSSHAARAGPQKVKVQANEVRRAEGPATEQRCTAFVLERAPGGVARLEGDRRLARPACGHAQVGVRPRYSSAERVSIAMSSTQAVFFCRFGSPGVAAPISLGGRGKSLQEFQALSELPLVCPRWGGCPFELRLSLRQSGDWCWTPIARGRRSQNPHTRCRVWLLARRDAV